MNFERVLHYFTEHVESIIQWLFLFILALTGFLISRGLLAKKQEGPGGEMMAPIAAGPSPELESMLKAILDRTQKLEAVSVQGMSPEAAALAETQVQSLKKELSSREEELKALKASGTGQGTTEEAAKLSSRLKELESKLAEYEILEDDIADLSLYKEENSRLRTELDKLKGGASAPTSAAEAAAPAQAAPIAEAAPVAAAPVEERPARSAIEAAAANPNVTDDIVAEFAQAVNSETVPEASEAPTMKVPDTGNPMSDFEAAVKAEKKLAEATKSSAPTTAPSAAAVEKPASGAVAGTPPPKAAAPEGESDDIFAEFAEAPVDEGSLDTDKMMAEMAALVSLEPSGDSGLEDGIDTDKMAAEAGNFQKR